MASCVTTPPTHAHHEHAAPASRASWSGQLQFGELLVPVKAYAAIASPPETPLRQLHSVCGERIEYKKLCPKHGVVPSNEIIKGYPYQPDQYVRLSTDDLERLQPTDDKTIHLERFVDPGAIDLVLLAGRSLFLLPANPAAHHSFAGLQQAIRQSGKWGVGKTVLSGKRQIVLLRPEESFLIVHTMHHPSLRRAVNSAERAESDLPAKELRSLGREINSANGEIPWNEFKDDSDQRLAQLVQAKLQPAKPRRNGKSRTKARTSAGTTPKRRKAA